ncbi:DUF6268 family outer membrane beta-barrel protein [Aequorivita antarctica]|uniref:DUF6268 domain-containing protein n=1 Tax=Aequorivita antarctica TaxID=153266 RepID=A0A5C6Z3L4_9FLAO|nr:DUF6268 family outer membrane beta-barrel protein [Aequorivita antarctica]TXD74100.1 hypothetical protein ESU54_06395 [Aequorivita antarctica]SRX73176.1 hypothetical protein AEQU3_00611 [Aequorivita antarctica]
MKRLLLLTFLFPFFSSAQEYVDLFRIGYGQTFENSFEGVDSNTSVKSFEAGFTFPVVLNENHALITGADFSSNNLQLFPEAEYTSLYSTNIKLGLASTWSEKWSTTIVLLPKIASDYKNISSNDFYMGGFALLKLKKNENLKYRFGVYASQEAFGLFTTPILGWYYLSPNKRFEMDMSLPISADVSYKLGITTIGVDYFGIGRSYNVHYENLPTLYADLSSLEFASYLQFNALEESVLLRAKLGYSSNNYEMYAEGDKIDLGISAFSFGDERTQLNPSLNGGIFFKFEAIYRFHIKEKSKAQEPNNN